MKESRYGGSQMSESKVFSAQAAIVGGNGAQGERVAAATAAEPLVWPKPPAQVRIRFVRNVATPADWKDGDKVVIVPSLKDPAVMKEKFPKGVKEIKPYLRTTPQPNL